MKLPTVTLGADDPLCARCSRLSGGCCVTSLNDTAYCFPLSEREIERLLPYAHLARDAQGEKEIQADLETRMDQRELAAKDSPQDSMNHAGLSRQAVCAPEKNTQEFLKSMGFLFPSQQKKIRELFSGNGHHFRLRLDTSGACVFLGKQGCRLPRQVRPWYCLLFPAWFQSGQLTIFLSDSCLATREVTEPLTALERLNITEQSAKTIFNHLIADWGFTDR